MAEVNFNPHSPKKRKKLMILKNSYFSFFFLQFFEFLKLPSDFYFNFFFFNVFSILLYLKISIEGEWRLKIEDWKFHSENRVIAGRQYERDKDSVVQQIVRINEWLKDIEFWDLFSHLDEYVSQYRSNQLIFDKLLPPCSSTIEKNSSFSL